MGVEGKQVEGVVRFRRLPPKRLAAGAIPRLPRPPLARPTWSSSWSRCSLQTTDLKNGTTIHGTIIIMQTWAAASCRQHCGDRPAMELTAARWGQRAGLGPLASAGLGGEGGHGAGGDIRKGTRASACTHAARSSHGTGRGLGGDVGSSS